MQRKAIFIAATGQNVGKTTICLGLIALLKRHFSKVGFIKPVGQQHETVEDDLQVDKDVILFKEYFGLPSSYDEMSPVILPAGFTRDFLDGKVDGEALKEKIKKCFKNVLSSNDFTIVEGTGHVGVGSIVQMNNAWVAALLGVDIVLITKGGLGRAFDELAINKALCDALGVPIRGVILNRVVPEKKEMIIHYMKKALDRWQIPLIGTLPFNSLLSTPSLEDFEGLFNTPLLAGSSHHYQHFETIRMLSSSVETFQDFLMPGQLIITPATREDIISHLLTKHPSAPSPAYGLILTGLIPPTPTIIEKLKKAEIPTIYAGKMSFDVMKMITSFTAKIRKEDSSKVEEAIQMVGDNIDFSFLM